MSVRNHNPSRGSSWPRAHSLSTAGEGSTPLPLAAGAHLGLCPLWPPASRSSVTSIETPGLGHSDQPERPRLQRPSNDLRGWCFTVRGTSWHSWLQPPLEPAQRPAASPGVRWALGERGSMAPVGEQWPGARYPRTSSGHGGRALRPCGWPHTWRVCSPQPGHSLQRNRGGPGVLHQQCLLDAYTSSLPVRFFFLFSLCF